MRHLLTLNCNFRLGTLAILNRHWRKHVRNFWIWETELQKPRVIRLRCEITSANGGGLCKIDPHFTVNHSVPSFRGLPRFFGGFCFSPFAVLCFGSVERTLI